MSKAFSKRPKGTGAGRGGPARGYSWEAFQPGHELSTTHGAYATLQLRPRAQEIAAVLAAAMDDEYAPKFQPAIETAALAFARVERAMGPLLEHDEDTIAERYSTLDDRARSWLRLGLQSLEALGLSPRVGSADVKLEFTQITIEQDAEMRARILGKLAGIGLLQPGVLAPLAPDVALQPEELPALPEGDGA